MHRKKCCDRQNETKLEKNKRKKIVNSSMQENSEQFYATGSLTALPMGQPVIYRKPRKESTKEAKIHVSLPWIFVLMLFCFNQDGTWELGRKDQKWDSRRMLPFSTFFFSNHSGLCVVKLSFLQQFLFLLNTYLSSLLPS